MISKRRHGLLLLAPRLFPAGIGSFVARGLPKKIGERVENIWTEWFLKFFLWVFGLSFRLFPDLRRNIEDFDGKYIFKTQNGLVTESAVFRRDGNGGPVMRREDEPVNDPDVTVVFKNAGILKRYLYSLADQDILELILADDIQLDGNWNYVCKFLFMIRDLRITVGLEEW